MCTRTHTMHAVRFVRLDLIPMAVKINKNIIKFDEMSSRIHHSLIDEALNAHTHDVGKPLKRNREEVGLNSNKIILALTHTQTNIEGNR